MISATLFTFTIRVFYFNSHKKAENTAIGPAFNIRSNVVEPSVGGGVAHCSLFI